MPTKQLGVASAQMDDIDWVERWKRVVSDHEGEAPPPPGLGYWDRRANSYARATHQRLELLSVVEPYLSPRKTLIDVGAGTGRHAVPLAAKVEWVTAVEPSEGMRSHIPPLDNVTVVASTWEDAEVAPADLVICAHVMYGVRDPVPFIAKLDAFSRERVFVMMRESRAVHPAVRVREKLLGESGPREPRFTELFMLLRQMGIAPDVTFLTYAFFVHYADMEEAVDDCRAFVGEGWDDARGRAILDELLQHDNGGLVFDGGMALTGVAHWKPQTSR
jgi:SAM-dependent methyltransferase